MGPDWKGSMFIPIICVGQQQKKRWNIGLKSCSMHTHNLEPKTPSSSLLAALLAERRVQRLDDARRGLSSGTIPLGEGLCHKNLHCLYLIRASWVPITHFERTVKYRIAWQSESPMKNARRAGC